MLVNRYKLGMPYLCLWVLCCSLSGRSQFGCGGLLLFLWCLLGPMHQEHRAQQGILETTEDHHNRTGVFQIQNNTKPKGTSTAFPTYTYW